MLFCVRSSLTHDRDNSLKKNIPALCSFFFSPPDASRHNISSIKQTTIYVLPAFDPKRTAEWLLLQKCKGRQRHKEKLKRKSERENRRRVKQCEELWIRRSEIRPFNCICALFSFFIHYNVDARSPASEKLLYIAANNETKIAFVRNFQLIYKSHSDKVPSSSLIDFETIFLYLVFLLFRNISAKQKQRRHTIHEKASNLSAHNT